MNLHRKLLAPLLATVLLAACGGSGLDGTYSDPTGVASYTFEPGGKVEVSVMGATTEMHYEVDGQKVKIGPEGGPAQVMTILKDGSISGPMGVKLTKKG